MLEDVLAEAGLSDTAYGRRRFMQRMEERRGELLIDAQKAAAALKTLRRGWIIGSEGFRDRIMDRMEDLLAGKKGTQIKRTDRQREHGKRLAERIVEAGLGYFGLKPVDLGNLPKSDGRKRIIGYLISRHTTVGLAWIGERLRMGDKTRVSRNCRLQTHKRPRKAQTDAAAILRLALGN